MCSRYSFVTSKEAVEEKFNIEISNQLRLSYNISPTQHAYIITNDNKEKLQYITWGLIPSWSRDGRNMGKLINARSESISSQTSFRIPIRRRRCLVIADSFYEWKRKGTDQVPYRIQQKNESLMVMAGIWDEWYKGDYALKSFSIITTLANKEMAEVYDRMPVILPDHLACNKWLEDIELGVALAMLKPLSDNLLDIYKISEKVNSPINNSIDIHRAI